MKFTCYSKFEGFDISSLDLGDLMQALSNFLLYSGLKNPWSLQVEYDSSLDVLRQVTLQALLEQGILTKQDIERMIAKNQGRFKGSLLEELINRLIERLVDEGYLRIKQVRQSEPSQIEGRIEQLLPKNIRFEVTEKGLDFLGYKTLQKLLGSLGRSSFGRHETQFLDTGIEASLSSRRYEFGDTMNLDINSTLLSAIQRNGLGIPIELEYEDLYVHQQEYFSSCATVLMLDCSHSMILYGEDRFTPAKKVALALAHLIRTQYPGDSLKIVLFHDSAEELPLAKLATVKVGPYHTNTAEGLRLAHQILNSQRKQMKQIVMITDGKPTAVFIDKKVASQIGLRNRITSDRILYKNSMGNDPFVMSETFKQIQACRKSRIMINTFMLASDWYLVEFVKKMTAMTQGKAYFANSTNLTEFVLMDFLSRKTKRVR